MEIKALPTGGCGKCGRAAQSDNIVGTRCANPLPEGPCTGSYRATLAPADWIVCSCCNGSGSGSKQAQRCARCEGCGWSYARPQFP